MTSVPGSESLAWSDEQTRLYLQLRIDEKLKGNIRNQVVNDTARQTIMDKFFEAYGERHPWKKFGIKFTTCKKQYESFKRLTRNKTGLGYDSNGFIDMSEDWWNERCKETFRFLVEDDDMDLVIEEEKNMYALLEEMYAVPEVNVDRQLVRTNRGGGWRRVQRFMFESENKRGGMVKLQPMVMPLSEFDHAEKGDTNGNGEW